MSTLRDVAERAGVTAQTVSNVVNGRDKPPYVTAETRERVLRALADLNYHPNGQARSLRNRRALTLGFVIVDESPAFLSDLFHSEVASGIAEVARMNDHWLLIHGLPPDEKAPDHVLQPYLQRRIDGAVVTLSGPRVVREACIRRLLAHPCPFVLFEECIDCPHGASMMGDNAGGASQAVAHLRRQGHERIVFLAGPSAWPAVEQRIGGYTAAMRDAGLESRVFTGRDGDTAANAEWSLRTGQRLGAAVLDTYPDLTALIAANDVLAAGAMQAIKALGRQVPGDVAIIGFDDFEFAQYLDPPLSSVKLAGLEMGQMAAQMLLQYGVSGRFDDKEVTFPTTLVRRASA